MNGTALMLRVASIAVPVALLLSSLSAIGAWVNSQRVAAQNDRLEEIVADQTASVDAQCSLYELVFRGDTPERRAAMDPEDLAIYDESIRVIHRDADSLGCPVPTDEP